MKKYLLGALAIIFAVAFSAFMTDDSSKTSGATEDALWWYPVKVASSDIDHTDLLNPGTKRTKTEMAGLSLIPCPQASGTDCMRGFDELQTEDHDDDGEDFTEKAN